VVAEALPQEAGSIAGAGAAAGELCSFYKVTHVDTQWR
jgi:hypothetical protein